MPLLSVKRNRNIISGKKHREQKSMYYLGRGERGKKRQKLLSLFFIFFTAAPLLHGRRRPKLSRKFHQNSGCSCWQNFKKKGYY